MKSSYSQVIEFHDVYDHLVEKNDVTLMPYSVNSPGLSLVYFIYSKKKVDAIFL